MISFKSITLLGLLIQSLAFAEENTTLLEKQLDFNFEEALMPGKCLIENGVDEKERNLNLRKFLSYYIIEELRAKDINENLKKDELYVIRNEVTGDIFGKSKFPKVFMEGFFRAPKGTQLVLPVQIKKTNKSEDTSGIGLKFGNENLIYFCLNYTDSNLVNNQNRLEVVFLESLYLDKFKDSKIGTKVRRLWSSGVTRQFIEKPFVEIDDNNGNIALLHNMPEDIFSGIPGLDWLSRLIGKGIIAPSELVFNEVLDLLAGLGVYRLSVKADRMQVYYKAKFLGIASTTFKHKPIPNFSAPWLLHDPSLFDKNP